MTTATEVAGAYKWTRDWTKEPLLPLPEIHNPAQGAVDQGLDDAVRRALEKSGLDGVAGEGHRRRRRPHRRRPDVAGPAPAYRVPRSRIEEAFG
ncbi:hypothetical protein [Kitasatospora sp. NPDC093679]|uniref:hypothetical protein n=1 Tax=Kitasatospora sp. NPDC093679 TaxID=3154983 RepID=UPI00342C530E